jgi:DNA-binding GntR family transcriptional regulator
MKTPPPRAQGGPAILASLRDDISSGKLAPGAVLRQAELAEQFGTSRIPVREALNSLQAEGLVQIEPNRGAFVTTLSAEELHELFDLRVLLEIDVLRRAVPMHTERSLRRLEAIQHELDGETVPTEPSTMNCMRRVRGRAACNWWLACERQSSASILCAWGRRRGARNGTMSTSA